MQVDHSKNIVEVKKVTFAYNDVPVLKDISLNIHKGDYLGIIGPNGGGKSTLVKLILGLLPLQSGEINVLTKSIAYVGQKATDFDQKFPTTVKDVVSMGRYSKLGLFRNLMGQDKQIVDESLRQVEMLEYKDRLIGNLSGGQQQKVFIARALAQKPDIIFLDEPTSGVDRPSQAQFYKILRDLNKNLGITLIIISHDVDVITSEVTEIAAVNHELIYYGDSKEFIKEERGIKFVHYD